MAVLEIFMLPFMQRALIAGLFLGLLLAMLGIYVSIKRMAFFGDGLAHASLAGIAFGLLLGWQPLWAAVLWAVAIALLMYLFERKTNLSSDTLIGIFFTASLALGVIVINLMPGYQPDLLSYLFGNILSVTLDEAIVITVIAAGLMIALSLGGRRLSLLALDPQQATLQGFKTTGLTIFLYVSLAVAVVLGVKLVGVILVSSLLIVPAASAKLVSRSFRGLKRNSLIFSLVAVLAGLVASFFLDWPSGATIVLVGFVCFIFCWLFSRTRQQKIKL
jgi:zinc transport system permease protein